MANRDGQNGERNVVALVVWIVIAAVMLLFIFNNSQATNVSVAFFDFTTPLWVLILATFLLGFVGGWIARWRTRRRP